MSRLVIIDAGHGEDTPGKRSPDGVLREWEWNRRVANLVIHFLYARGVDCIEVAFANCDTPLKDRVRRANQLVEWAGGKDKAILVSIHANAAGNGSKWMDAKGWSCYTTKGSTESDVLAEHLYAAFEEEFPDRKIRTDKSDGDKDWEEDFYILKHTACPAVLTENFFYDNREECSWMLKDSTIKSIAWATANGICRYLLSKEE